MKAQNKKFRVELGINLHAAPVPQTNPNMRIFPLQNALIDITKGRKKAKPAWYSRLTAGDEISFRLVDISNRRTPTIEPEYPRFVLVNFYFTNPTTGQPANPFTKNIVEWQISDRLRDQKSPVYSHGPLHRLATWDLVALSKKGKEFTSLKLAKCGDHQQFRAFELTVALKMARDGWVNHYVFDPEMIVSETDNEGDQSGGKRS